MTLKEAFDQGACKVGNLIILEGGESFLVGDATPFHGPSVNDAGLGWEGWFEKNVFYIFDLLDAQGCAILEKIKEKAAIPQESKNESIATIQEGS